MSPGIFCLVGSGPDVFADALVPAGAGHARFFLSPRHRRSFGRRASFARRVSFADGYRFAEREW